MLRLFVTILFVSFFSVPQSVAQQSTPAMWKVSDEDTNIHIFGSVHILKPGTVWLTSDLQNIITGSDALYFEMSAEQSSPPVIQPLMMSYGFLTPEDHLKNHINEDLYASLHQEFSALGMPEESFAIFKPWTAALVYSTVKFMKLGYSPEAGVEAVLTNLAQAQGIEIRGFETAEYQLSLFNNMSNENQKNMLEQTLRDKDKIQEIMENMTLFWTTGNTDELLKEFNKGFDDYPYLRQTLLTTRNQNWVGDIQEILEKPGNYVVTVGTAHLIGDKSLIELLGDANIEVSRIQ